MDIKNTFDSYDLISGIINIDVENIKRSIDILKSSNIDYEFRTTVTKELHSFEKIKEICKYLGPSVKYYIQNYRDCETVLVGGFHGFDKDELLNIKDRLKNDYPNLNIRGI